MREKFFTNDYVAARAEARWPGYLAELERCVTRRNERGIWVDLDSPDWAAMKRKHAGRQPARRVGLRVILPPEVVEARRSACAICGRRIGQDCGKVAETRPHNANIDAGTLRGDVACPLGYWGKWPSLSEPKP